jgi:hypothetical protein
MRKDGDDMKNIQIIDGALNSTFDIYQIRDDLYKLIFPNDSDIAFIEDVESISARSGIDKFWDRIYRHKVDKRQVRGIHGTLHLTGSHVSKQYFPTGKESEVARDMLKP